MMVLLLDNHDSFTWNVFQLLSELGATVLVARSSDVDVARVRELEPERIVISPGPGGPHEAGASCSIVRELAGTVPIFGICLGLQCIGAVFGGRIVRAGELVHGRTSAIHHDSSGVFAGLPTPFEAVRYHSLVVDRASVPAGFEVTAETSHGLVMGMRHAELGVEGVQFHPESILSEHGRELLANVLRMHVAHAGAAPDPTRTVTTTGHTTRPTTAGGAA